MTARPAVDPTRLCQIEIQVTDVPRALAFYADAFGWTSSPAEIFEFHILDVPKESPFGIALVPDKDARERGACHTVTLYFSVDNPEAILERAEACGGRRVVGPYSVMGYGQVWHLEDPDGNRWGIFKA